MLTIETYICSVDMATEHVCRMWCHIATSKILVLFQLLWLFVYCCNFNAQEQIWQEIYCNLVAHSNMTPHSAYMFCLLSWFVLSLWPWLSYINKYTSEQFLQNFDKQTIRKKMIQNSLRGPVPTNKSLKQITYFSKNITPSNAGNSYWFAANLSQCEWVKNGQILVYRWSGSYKPLFSSPIPI